MVKSKKKSFVLWSTDVVKQDFLQTEGLLLSCFLSKIISVSFPAHVLPDISSEQEIPPAMLSPEYVHVDFCQGKYVAAFHSGGH